MKIGGNFNCSNNRLKSLKGAPEYVGGDFDCSFNQIENINDLTTTYIGGDFYCYGNDVTDEDVRILKEKNIVKGEIYYKDSDDPAQQLFRGRKSVPGEEAVEFFKKHKDLIPEEERKNFGI